MNDDYVHDVSFFLDSVRELTGVHTLWKKASGGAETALPEYQRLHCNDFCKLVKKVRRRTRDCSLNDCVSIREKAEKFKAPFLNKCHAGVYELIVPVFIEGVYDSAFFFGPFRRNKTEVVAAFLRSEFRKLKVISRKEENSVEKMLSSFLCFVRENTKSFAIRNASEKSADARIQKALEYIDRHFKSAILADDIAGICGLSTSRFIHLFKEECGVSFSEYLIDRRMQEAELLLSETEMKINDIAEACGYHDQCYFGLVFRKKTGLSPGLYRKRNAKPGGV